MDLRPDPPFLRGQSPSCSRPFRTMPQSSPVHRITQLPRWKKQLNPHWRQARAKLLSHPSDRLDTVWEVAVALELGLTIDANRATADQWLRLPGISIRQAQLLSDLTQGGMQFHALENIAAALGVTEDTLAIAAPLKKQDMDLLRCINLLRRLRSHHLRACIQQTKPKL